MDVGNADRASWLKAIASMIRDIYPSLSVNMQRSPMYWGLNHRPLQILAFTADPPSITKIFILHLKSVSDLTVWAYGPLKPYELVSLFEQTRKDAILQEDIPKGSAHRPALPAPQTVAALLERSMLEFLEQVRGKLLDPPGGGGQSSSNYAPVYQEVTLFEEYINTAPETMINKWIDADKEMERLFNRFSGQEQRFTRSQIEAEIRARDESMDWSGAFYFPPIRIGPLPDTTLKERLSPDPYRFDLGKVAFMDKIGSEVFLATFYGCIAVQTRKEELACELLNLLCGAFHLTGIPSFRIRPRDLVHFKLDQTTNTFTSTSVPPTERAVGNKDSALNKFHQPVAVSSDQVKEALRSAEQYFRDTRLRSYIPLLLDSFGRLRSKEWDYSFYSAWMIIEMETVLDWEEAMNQGLVLQPQYEGLRRASIDDARVRDLPRKVDLVKSVADKLTVLRLIAQLSAPDFETWDRLRNRRNEILHPDTPAMEMDANECYRAAENIIRARAKRLE